MQWQVVHGFREWGPSLALNDPTPLHLEQRPLSLHDLQDFDAISANPPFSKGGKTDSWFLGFSLEIRRIP